MALSLAQNIECFHLAFLEVLRTRLDASRYVLKGGANLRYFFDSVRYSEDIDLDVHGVADHRLAEQVENVLLSDTLARVLGSAGISIEDGDVTKKKDSPVTKRWRVWLAAPGHGEKIRTKVEFSARNGEARFELASVPSQVVKPYALRPASVQHYLLAPATEQKVIALAKRPQSQARDVFDLDLLLRRASLEPGAVDEPTRRAAAEAAVALGYDDFDSMVRPFLDPQILPLYDRKAWEGMQHFVSGELLG